MKYFLTLLFSLAIIPTANASGMSLTDYCSDFMRGDDVGIAPSMSEHSDRAGYDDMDAALMATEKCESYLMLVAEYTAVTKGAEASALTFIVNPDALSEDVHTNRKWQESLESRIIGLENDLLEVFGMQDEQPNILLVSFTQLPPETEDGAEAEQGYFLKSEDAIHPGSHRFLIAASGVEEWHSLGDMVNGQKLVKKNGFLYVGDNLVKILNR